MDMIVLALAKKYAETLEVTNINNITINASNHVIFDTTNGTIDAGIIPIAWANLIGNPEDSATLVAYLDAAIDAIKTPTIFSIYTDGTSGTMIQGKDFGDPQGTGTIKYNGVDVQQSDIDTWNDVQIILLMPTVDQDKFVVTSDSGGDSNEFTYISSGGGGASSLQDAIDGGNTVALTSNDRTMKFNNTANIETETLETDFSMGDHNLVSKISAAFNSVTYKNSNTGEENRAFFGNDAGDSLGSIVDLRGTLNSDESRLKIIAKPSGATITGTTDMVKAWQEFISGYYVKLQSTATQLIDSEIALDRGNQLLGTKADGSEHVIAAAAIYVTASGAEFPGSKTVFGVPFTESDVLADQTKVNYVTPSKAIITTDGSYLYYDNTSFLWTVFTPGTTINQTELGNGAEHTNFNTNNDPVYGKHVTADTPFGKETVAYLSDIKPVIVEALENMIQGMNFGTVKGTLTINGTDVPAGDIDYWSNSYIETSRVHAPNIVNGDIIQVILPDGTESNIYTVHITAPPQDKFPVIVEIYTDVASSRIQGIDFGSPTAGNIDINGSVFTGNVIESADDYVVIDQTLQDFDTVIIHSTNGDSSNEYIYKNDVDLEDVLHTGSTANNNITLKDHAYMLENTQHGVGMAAAGLEMVNDDTANIDNLYPDAGTIISTGRDYIVQFGAHEDINNFTDGDIVARMGNLGGVNSMIVWKRVGDEFKMYNEGGDEISYPQHLEANDGNTYEFQALAGTNTLWMQVAVSVDAYVRLGSTLLAAPYRDRLLADVSTGRETVAYLSDLSAFATPDLETVLTEGNRANRDIAIGQSYMLNPGAEDNVHNLGHLEIRFDDKTELPANFGDPEANIPIGRNYISNLIVYGDISSYNDGDIIARIKNQGIDNTLCRWQMVDGDFQFQNEHGDPLFLPHRLDGNDGLTYAFEVLLPPNSMALELVAGYYYDIVIGGGGHMGSSIELATNKERIGATTSTGAQQLAYLSDIPDPALPVIVDILTETNATLIQGKGFSDTQGTVKINGGDYTGTITSWDDSEIIIAQTINDDDALEVVSDTGETSNRYHYHVPAAAGAGYFVTPEALNAMIGENAIIDITNDAAMSDVKVGDWVEQDDRNIRGVVTSTTAPITTIDTLDNFTAPVNGIKTLDVGSLGGVTPSTGYTGFKHAPEPNMAYIESIESIANFLILRYVNDQNSRSTFRMSDDIRGDSWNASYEDNYIIWDEPTRTLSFKNTVQVDIEIMPNSIFGSYVTATQVLENGVSVKTVSTAQRKRLTGTTSETIDKTVGNTTMLHDVYVGEYGHVYLSDWVISSDNTVRAIVRAVDYSVDPPNIEVETIAAYTPGPLFIDEGRVLDSFTATLEDNIPLPIITEPAVLEVSFTVTNPNNSDIYFMLKRNNTDILETFALHACISVIDEIVVHTFTKPIDPDMVSELALYCTSDTNITNVITCKLRPYKAV